MAVPGHVGVPRTGHDGSVGERGRFGLVAHSTAVRCHTRDMSCYNAMQTAILDLPASLVERVKRSDHLLSSDLLLIDLLMMPRLQDVCHVTFIRADYARAQCSSTIIICNFVMT